VGADSIPFTVYEELGIHLRGFMPQGFERSGGDGREVAARYGLSEGEGGHKWRDMKNVDSADACLAFLANLPMTGRGTMQTVNYCVTGRYKHVQLEKPHESDYTIIDPGETGKPAIVFWDISEDKLDSFASALQEFLCAFQPASLMLSGPMEHTWPGIERLGAELLRRSLQQQRGPAALLADDQEACWQQQQQQLMLQSEEPLSQGEGRPAVPAARPSRRRWGEAGSSSSTA